MCTARYETPTKSEIAITPITTSVRAAFSPCGVLNAPTPFEIDSTPVSAAAPDAKARSTTSTPTLPAAPTVIGSGTCAWGQPLTAHFPTPTPIITYITATNE